MDVLVFFEHRVVDGELLPDLWSVATGTDGTLDLLLKLGTSPLLYIICKTYSEVSSILFN